MSSRSLKRPSLVTRSVIKNKKRRTMAGVKRQIPEVSRKTSPICTNKSVENMLKDCLKVSPPTRISLETLIENSDSFPIDFPIDTPRCKQFIKKTSKQVLEDHANSVYPLVHEAMLSLIADWLEHKKNQGSTVEREVYKNMGLIDLVQRLLERRSVSFLGRKDLYKTFEVKRGYAGWEDVGTDREKAPLLLRKYISYDEMKLSAMLTMSSHTEFVNDGSRRNKGVVPSDLEALQPGGVIMGVVGSRFQRPGYMEYQDIAVAEEQNTEENGYGPVDEASTQLRGLRQVWARFYDEPYLPLHSEVVQRPESQPDDGRYVPVTNKYIFDAANYIKRTLITAEMILLDANARALEKKTTAYVHVVGFGLGVWKALPEQEVYFVKSFEMAIKGSMKNLANVSDVMFSYMQRETSCGGVEDGGSIGHINIHFGKREPHDRLDDENKLLVVTYAWDGNAFPGNEFWMGKLASSGDSAAACSTQITELHNVRINPRAGARSLRIASPEHGIVGIADYAKLKLGIDKPRS